MISKTCIECKEIKEAVDFYKNKRNSDGLHSYCKECAKKKSWKYQQEKEYWKTAYVNNKEFYNNKSKNWSEENSAYHKELQKEWRSENKDKLREYQKSRNENKKHTISDVELSELYIFAESSCMYCGLTEEESIAKYGQKLHRDHAYSSGSNGIDNCILACKSCNSSKHNKNWDEWYINTNRLFNTERLEKIEIWLGRFKSN